MSESLAALEAIVASKRMQLAAARAALAEATRAEAAAEAQSEGLADALAVLSVSSTEPAAAPVERAPAPSTSTPTINEVPAPAEPRVALVWSTEMELHASPPGHPERPERHAAVVQRFHEVGLVDRCTMLPPREATDEELLRAHSAEHLKDVASRAESAGDDVSVSGDMFCNRHTHRAARLAAGCVVDATLSVVRGDFDASFAVVRPPGHHAECGRAMGFCWYNNCSVAALAALQEPGVSRVAIVDWDVHHGNGIEAISYEDSRVLYISLHRFGAGFYPGTGAVGALGRGAGRGFNVNIPWTEARLGDADYLAAVQLVVAPVLSDFKADVLLISAGFDAADGDPLGGMCVSPAGYQRMALALADCVPSRRCVALLEGGYNLHATARSAEATLRALLGERAPEAGGRSRPKRSSEEALRAVVRAQAPHWPCLSEEAVTRHFAPLSAAAQPAKAGLGGRRASGGLTPQRPVAAARAPSTPPIV